MMLEKIIIIMFMRIKAACIQPNIFLAVCMQIFVNHSFLSASYGALISARKIGYIPCQRFLPKLYHGLEYYTFEDESV